MTDALTTITTREAKAAILGVATSIRERIYQTILGHGLRGCTAAELEHVLGVPGSTVRPRLVELRGVVGRPETARIVTMGELRMTASGRRAVVWIAREVAK
jgi:hypothetical protein